MKNLRINKAFEVITLEQFKSLDVNFIFFWGDINDLSIKAQEGLLLHLYGWCYIQNQEEKSEQHTLTWYEKDAMADNIASGWGFTEEILALRKVRPLKEEDLLEGEKPEFLSRYSIPNINFERKIASFYLSQTKELKAKIDNDYIILFKDKFSVVIKTSLISEGKSLIVVSEIEDLEIRMKQLLEKQEY